MTATTTDEEPYRLCRSKASQNFSNAENVSLIAQRRDSSAENLFMSIFNLENFN